MKNSEFRIQKLKNFFHLSEALLGNIFYGFPSRKIKVIGITGTDGKTTTTHLIYHILTYAGKKTSMISTVYAKVGDQEYDTGLHTTTPGRFAIPKFLSYAVHNNDEYFVLEITSHAIDQNRDFGVDYYVGALTNVTHEHLDYHHDYQNYLLTKARLLLRSKNAFINVDDGSFEPLRNLLLKHKKTFYTFGQKNKRDLTADINKRLTDYNVSNYALAHGICSLLGVPRQTIIAAMKTFVLPKGRLDVVYDKKFKIIIDFAHTPNGIDKLLQGISTLHRKNGGRIIHVFGSAGQRDASKRPFMGEASARHSDIAILTEEDYRTEDPERICEEIARGFKKKKKSYTIILDRRKAIQYAIRIARKDDVVVLTGKGHEKSLCREKTEYPWDEYKEVYDNL